MPASSSRAWQYASTKGGLDNNIKLNTVPVPQPKPGQHLVQVLYAALNPVDYKPAEFSPFSYLMIPKPATPGIDFAARIVEPAAGSDLKPGQLIFGAAAVAPWAAGALREYATVPHESITLAPEGVSPRDLASICVAGETAYQSIQPHVKAGDKIFINGGSGGCGIFGIQIAKALGCSVTTACSSANVELCKSLGADTVIDYKKQSVINTLAAEGQVYDHVVDNVGSDSAILFKAHHYTKPTAVVVPVGGEPSLGALSLLLRMMLPGFLGGPKRRRVGMFAQAKPAELSQIATWMKEGKVKAVIDSEYAFEKVPEAFRQLKTGRAKGKVVVQVAQDP